MKCAVPRWLGGRPIGEVLAEVVEGKHHQLGVSDGQLAALPASHAIARHPEYPAQVGLAQVQRLTAFAQLPGSYGHLFRGPTIRYVSAARAGGSLTHEAGRAPPKSGPRRLEGRRINRHSRLAAPMTARTHSGDGRDGPTPTRSTVVVLVRRVGLPRAKGLPASGLGGNGRSGYCFHQSQKLVAVDGLGQTVDRARLDG